MAQRYDICMDPEGQWTVIDRFTGWPAEELGVVLVGLLVEVADDLVDLLNARDLKDRKARGID